MRSFTSVLIFCALISTQARATAPDAEALLEKAEAIRNPQQDYRVHISLVDKTDSKSETSTYETLIKGRDKALVRFLTPVSDKGTRVLMVDADMWVYMPSTAKPIRISPRQRLAGNAAYGDVARLNFTKNYTAKFLREDSFSGKKADVLDLTAVDGRPVTYDKVEYWIDAISFQPLKAVYKAESGKELRECTFTDYKEVLGEKRPTRFVLVDAIRKDHVTTLTFTDAKKQAFPDLLFDKQNLSRD